MSLEPTNNVTPFSFNGSQIRVIAHGDGYWFLAEDVCQALALANRSQALSRLDDDEKGTIIINDKQVLIVSEPALYALTMRSRKEETKAFRRWVTHEVLPALRKTGRYEVQPQQHLTPLDALEQMLTALRSQDRRLELLEGGQVELEHRFDDQPISAHADKERHIQALIKQIAETNGGGTFHFRNAYGRFKAFFNLPGKFSSLKVSEYPKAVEVLSQWLEDARRDRGSLYN